MFLEGSIPSQKVLGSGIGRIFGDFSSFLLAKETSSSDASHRRRTFQDKVGAQEVVNELTGILGRSLKTAGTEFFFFFFFSVDGEATLFVWVCVVGLLFAVLLLDFMGFLFVCSWFTRVVCFERCCG